MTKLRLEKFAQSREFDAESQVYADERIEKKLEANKHGWFRHLEPINNKHNYQQSADDE